MSRNLLAALLLLPGTALAQTALQNGIDVPIDNTMQGTVRTYTLVVPNNMDELRVILSGGAGDADLYVNFDEPFLNGSDPDPSADCESVNFGVPEEDCTITNPLPGTWYIQVDAFDDYGGGVRLVAVAAVELADDVDETPISAADGNVSWYFIEVPASQGHLNVTTSGGTGNPNLFVGPDLFGIPECESESGNTADDCSIDQPAAGTWFVQIFGADAYSGVTLNAEYGPERPPNAGGVSGGPMAPLTLGGLLLAGFAAAIRRRHTRTA